MASGGALVASDLADGRVIGSSRFHGYDAELRLRIGTGNLRSQRAAERIGGVRDGTRPDGRGGLSFVYRLRRSADHAVSGSADYVRSPEPGTPEQEST
jgi:hypothetical protein